MAEPIELSCFVPAFNEEALIAHNLGILDAVLDEATASHEIVVVDDGSTDGTAAAVEGSGIDRVRLRRFRGGPSFRENLGRAMRRARGRIIMFVDADLAVDPESIGTVLDAVRSGADVAVGSRYVDGASATRHPSRRLISVVYNRFLRLVLRSRFQDHQCGLKAFRRPVLRRLLDAMYDGDRSQRAWFWDAELLLRADWAGYRVDELPVRWVCRPDSRFMLQRQLRILPYALRLFVEERLRASRAGRGRHAAASPASLRSLRGRQPSRDRSQRPMTR